MDHNLIDAIDLESLGMTDPARIAAASEQALKALLEVESDADFRLSRYDEECSCEGVEPDYSRLSAYAAEYELGHDSVLIVASVPGEDYIYKIKGPMPCEAFCSREEVIPTLMEILY